MKKVPLLLFYALYSLCCLGQQKCKYPKNLRVEFSVVEQKVRNAEDARFKVTFQNYGKKPILIYSNLVDGDLYGYDSNFLIELKFKESDSVYKEFFWKQYGSIFPPDGSNFPSQLEKTMLERKQNKSIYFDFFPNYIKQLKVGQYVARIGLRKIHGSKKKDCGEYYFSEPIYFEVINALKQVDSF